MVQLVKEGASKRRDERTMKSGFGLLHDMGPTI